VEDKEIEEKKEGEEEELIRRREGENMLGFIAVSTFLYVLKNYSPHFRPTQMKILQNVREGNVYLNYLFVCVFMPAFCDLNDFT
jgi:hypothetical protein